MMNNIFSVIHIFAVSLSLTLLLEFSIALLFRVKGRDLLLVFLANLLTNPLVVYLNMLLTWIFPDVFPIWQMPLEISVVLAESLLYIKYSDSISRPVVFAFCANAFSYCTGVIINLIF